MIRQWKNLMMEPTVFTGDCLLQTAYCKLATANWLLATHALCLTPYTSRLTTANCQLATADFSLLSALCAMRYAKKLKMIKHVRQRQMAGNFSYA